MKSKIALNAMEILIEHVKHVKGLLESVKSGIESKSRNLEIYKKDRGAGSAADAWPSGGILDDELSININSQVNWFRQSKLDQDETMLHELLHLWGTDDLLPNNPWNDSHMLDDLIKGSFTRHPSLYGALKQKGDKKKKSGECCCPTHK